MKNTFLNQSDKIHPGYFEFVRQPQSEPLQVVPDRVDYLIKLVKLFALSSVTILSLSLLPSFRKSEAMVTAPLPAPLSLPSDYQAIERRLELVGEILNYLFTRVEGEPSVSMKREALHSQTCRVNVPKAFLRVGPGKNFAPLMAVSEGSTLVVEVENGEWLQVVSPTGQSAWVSRDVVAL